MYSTERVLCDIISLILSPSCFSFFFFYRSFFFFFTKGVPFALSENACTVCDLKPILNIPCIPTFIRDLIKYNMSRNLIYVWGLGLFYFNSHLIFNFWDFSKTSNRAGIFFYSLNKKALITGAMLNINYYYLKKNSTADKKWTRFGLFRK